MADLTLHIDTSDGGDSDDDYGYGNRYVEGDGGDKAQIQKLIQQINICLGRWGDDPGYEKVAHRLREAKYELEFICASPGHREALRASIPHDASGQGPDRHAEY